ncbi:MAG: hypothetical protein ACI93L_003310 [Cyclobacteriaceae bacterium]|jgi:hypothetical protein
MILSEEELTDIQSYAGACMTKAEICLIMQFDLKIFESELQDIDSNVYKAYQSGFLLTKYDVQKKIIDLAKAGSSPAQTQALGMIKDIEISSYE